MVGIRGLVRLFERGFLARFYFELLYLSLLVLVDGFVLVIVSRELGIFSTLAIEATTSLIGSFIVLDSTRRLVSKTRERIRLGEYPSREFADLAGCIVAGILIVIPGLSTSVLGIILFLPGVRTLLGRVITRRMSSELDQAYQHLKLQEFEGESELPDAVHKEKKQVVRVDEAAKDSPRASEELR